MFFLKKFFFVFAFFIAFNVNANQFSSINPNSLNIAKTDEITNFLKSNGLNIKCPVLRNRTSPNTFYITIGENQSINDQSLLNVYKSYGNSKKKFKKLTLS